MTTRSKHVLTQDFRKAKFWIIAFDPAIQIINEGGLFGQGFEDDCAASIGGEDLNDLTVKMNSALDRLFCCMLAKHGLTKLPPNKSNA